MPLSFSRMSLAHASPPPTEGVLSAKGMKGIGFVNVRQYVLKVFGAGHWERVLTKLDVSDRAVVASVVALGWYDVQLFARLLRTVDVVCGYGDLGALKAVGRFEAEQDFNRAVRMLLRVVSPASIFTGHARLWTHFQDSGKWTIEKRQLSMACTLSGWAKDSALCTELSGYLERMVEFTGGQNVHVSHNSCRATGATDCVFVFRWT